MADKQDLRYQAVVEKIVPTGRHGPFAVARHEEIGIVTFSLGASVWEEKSRPQPGVFVLLWDLRKTRAGWRAEGARYFQPTDEKAVVSNEQPVTSKKEAKT